MFAVTQEIVGFFIIETHVLSTTGNFRSERDVEELWDALLSRLSSAVERALQRETEADSYLRVKEGLIAFVLTLEVSLATLHPAIRSKRDQAYSYSTTSLHSFIIVLFERYVSLLEKQFGARFESVSLHIYLALIHSEFIIIRLSPAMIVYPCMWRQQLSGMVYWTLYGSNEESESDSASEFKLCF